MIRIGAIGYGGRGQGILDEVDRLSRGAEVVAITDVRNDEIRRQMTDAGKDPSKVAFYTEADEMLDKENLDAVLIGTRCGLHSQMAIKVLQRNLPLFLEKPVATNMADLIALRDAAAKSTSGVVVSFPLRVTPLVQMAKQIIDSGQIGTVEHVQAWNNPSYGWHYFQTWYRDENETQGLFLQKATHDFDYINYIMGVPPVRIAAMKSKQVFKGDKPAGLYCRDCDEWDNCLESPFHAYFTKIQGQRVADMGLQCCFAKDTGNEDSGSALIEYETGAHASYTQSFICRNAAGNRGARLIGYKGTIEFDWSTDELKVMMHHSPKVETHKLTASAGHGGGDAVLADSFLRIIKRERPSVAPLEAGLMSALMCLRARESAESRTFQEIDY